MAITMLSKKLTWGVHCACWARAQILHLISFFQAAGQTSGRIRLILCGPMDTIWGQYSLGHPVISGTSSTCQRGGIFKHGIIRVCEFLSWRPQTRHIGTSWEGITTLFIKMTWGAHCTCLSARAHVRTCRCSPVFRISGTAGRIVLKFGAWLQIH